MENYFIFKFTYILPLILFFLLLVTYLCSYVVISVCEVAKYLILKSLFFVYAKPKNTTLLVLWKKIFVRNKISWFCIKYIPGVNANISGHTCLRIFTKIYRHRHYRRLFENWYISKRGLQIKISQQKVKRN